MSIEDSNPERRNLIVLSMAIIAFYIGDATVGKELELPLVKLTFKNAAGLGYLMWLMLGWFWFRYWITAKNEQIEKVNTELHYKQYGLIFFEKKLRQLFLKNPKESIKSIRFKKVEGKHGNHSTLHLHDFPDSEDYIPREHSESYWPDVRSNWILRIILFVALIRLFFSYPALSTYYAPYCVAIFAVAFGCKLIG